MSAKINKNGTEYPIGVMPQHYPADRVYLDGDVNKSVQDAVKEVTGTFLSTDGNAEVLYPTGFTNTNTYIIGFKVKYGTTWWDGSTLMLNDGKTKNICFTATKINVYNNNSALYGCDFKLLLMKV